MKIRGAGSESAKDWALDAVDIVAFACQQGFAGIGGVDDVRIGGGWVEGIGAAFDFVAPKRSHSQGARRGAESVAD